jgi:hypothetical protein
MAKPPFFEGNTGEKTESISTWWKQVGHYAKAYDPRSRAIVIKSYLHGSAALWLDSREREIGRDLTVQELADGLTQEYGSETTSSAAVQRLEALSMVSLGCATLAGYNAEFNKLYNQCSVSDQPIATRCYIKGLLPKYMKWLVLSDDVYTNLAEAKAAATRAVAKHDMMLLNYANFDLQKGRSAAAQKLQNSSTLSSERSSSSTTSSQQNNKRWNNSGFTGTKVSLSALVDSDSPEQWGETDDDDTNDQQEGKVAIVSSVGQGNGSIPNPNDQGTFPLTDAQQAMLRKGNRCFQVLQGGPY